MPEMGRQAVKRTGFITFQIPENHDAAPLHETKRENGHPKCNRKTRKTH